MQETISKFLLNLKIPVSRTYCENLISSHANYPSLLSIIDTLDTLGITNVAAKIDKGKLHELTFPYLLQLDTMHGDIIAIKSEEDLILRQTDLQMWNGVVVKIEQTSTIRDEENNLLYNRENFYRATKFILASALTGLLLCLVIGNYSFISILLLSTSILGAVVGYLLIAKELGTKYSIVEKFCTSGKNTDCDKILNSESAKLFGDVKLADAVLAYFIFQVGFLVTSISWSQEGYSILMPVSLLGLLLVPIGLYSIYYQHFIAKTWCRLCLIVDGIIAIQALLFAYLIINHNLRLVDIDYQIILLELVVFIIISCVILLCKNKIEEANKLSEENVRSSRVRNNSEVFRYFLKQQNKANTAFMEHEICMGENIDAPVKIVMVSNLYCNPCKKQHEIVEQLINTFPDKVRVAIRFVVSKDRATNQYLIQYWWKFIHNKEDESINTQKLIHEWYAVMDLEKFKQKFPLEIAENHPACEEIERQHLTWIKEHNAYRTPTFFIDGYQMPGEYEMKDLKPLISILSAESKTSSLESSSVNQLKHEEFV